MERSRAVSGEGSQAGLRCLRDGQSFCAPRVAHPVLSPTENPAATEPAQERESGHMDLHRLNRAQARYENGMEHLRRRQYQSAANSFAKAIQLDRVNADYRYLRGLAYFHLDQYDKAIADFRGAVARESGHARAYTCLASTYAMTGEYELAVEFYEEAIRVDPEYTEAFSGLELVRAFLGDRTGPGEDLEDETAIAGRIDFLRRHVRVGGTEGTEPAAGTE